MIIKSTPPATREVKLINQLAYGGGNLLGSGALAISAAWLMYFYTTFCGLTIIEASLIFSIATVIDAISNPIIGYFSDSLNNTKLGRKFGRRRFFLLISIPLLSIYPMIWVDGFGFFYYLTTYVAFEIVYTAIMVPYASLASEMTDDFGARSKLTGFKAVFGKIANFLAAFIPGQYILLFGKDSADSFFYTGLTYGIIMCVAITVLYCYSWEREHKSANTDPDKKGLIDTLISMFKEMISVFSLKVFRKHIGMYLFGFGAEWLFATVFTYFVIFVLNYDPSVVAGLNSVSSLVQILSTVLFISFCVKAGFSKPYAVALGVVMLTVLGYGSLYFLNLDPTLSLILVFTITIIFGLGTGGVYYIPWTVYTFLADVDEVYTGRRREGIYAGAMTFCGKLTRSCIVFIMGSTLSFFGFQAKAQTQPESAVLAISMIFIIGFLVLASIAIYFSFQMKLDKQSHAVVLAEVARIKSGGKIQDISPEARAVIEDLVGHKYEQCWGNNEACKKMNILPSVYSPQHS